MQNDILPLIMETSAAQQRPESAAVLAHWPAGARKPSYVNDPHFAQFCLAVAEALLERAKHHAEKASESRILA